MEEKSPLYEESKTLPVILPNHVEEYISQNLGEQNFIELFEATDENVDLRTDVTHEELILINKLLVNNQFLKSKGLGTPYSDFINHYLRLKVSKDRLSRAEFVDINRKERFEQNMSRFNNLKQLMDVKQ